MLMGPSIHGHQIQSTDKNCCPNSSLHLMLEGHIQPLGVEQFNMGSWDFSKGNGDMKFG
jgi:hypothetical protein